MDTGKAKEYLKALGVSAEDIAKLEDTEKAKDFDVKGAASSLKKAQQAELREALKNDADLNDELSKKAAGQLFGTLRSELKRAGLSTEEVAEDKTIKDMVKSLTEKLSAGKSEDLKQLQEQLMEKTAEVKRLTDEEIPRIQKEEAAKADRDRVLMKMERQFLGFPAHDLVSEKHNDGIFNALMAGLESKYDVRLGEDGNPTLYQKGKDLYAKNKDGDKLLGITDAIRDQLTEYGFVKQNNGGAPQGGTSATGREGDTPPPKSTGTASSGKERALQMAKDIETYGQR